MKRAKKVVMEHNKPVYELRSPALSQGTWFCEKCNKEEGERNKKEEKPEFEEDWREKNPGLHLLHMAFAAPVLGEIDRSMSKFLGMSNTHAYDVRNALFEARAKLIRTNAAYADVAKIVELYNKLDNEEDTE